MKRVRTYSSLDGIEEVPRLAARHGLTVTAGAWLDQRMERNEQEVVNLIRNARAYRNIDRLIVMNTGLGVGRSPGPGFDAWKAFVASRPDFPIGVMMQRSVAGLSDAEAAAYDAPFPDATYRAGVRRFPALVPVSGSPPLMSCAVP